MNPQDHLVTPFEADPDLRVPPVPDESTTGQPITYTVITSRGKPLGKRIYLEEGALRKEALGNLTNGEFTTYSASSLTQFGDKLTSLSHCDAVLYGVFHQAGVTVQHGDVVTISEKQTAAAKGETHGNYTRSREDMCWPSGAGVLFLDYDPPTDASPLSRDELVKVIRDSCPELQPVEMLWRPSASSNIKDTTTGEIKRGVAGQRLYIVVSSAGDSPRIGRIIHQRLWLNGHGRYDISRAGSLLERSLVDTSVWTPERLDFAGGAVCDAPLAQFDMVPVLIPGESKVLDVKSVKPLTQAEERKVKKLQQEARSRLKPEVAAKRERYVDERAAEIAGSDTNPEKLHQAKETVRKALEGRSLNGEFLLRHSSGMIVAVKDILDDPERWHGERFYDPLEPEYPDGDCRVAYLNTRGGRKTLYSHAHGGQRYTLVRAPKTVIVQEGATHLRVDECLSVICESGELYDAGDAVIRIDDREMIPVSSDWLLDYMARRINFVRYRRPSKETKEDDPASLKPTDPPPKYAHSILAKRGERGFQKVKAVATAPTMTGSGRIITDPGLDEETGLLLIALDNEEWPDVPENPSVDEARVALDMLLKPFSTFPFVDASNRGVMLAALLTAAVRAGLKTAPAFGFDAPAAGSGKTLAARCVAILATGREPAISPPFDDEAEARKRIFSELARGSGAILVDNVVGSLDSASLAGALTSESYEDRILGASMMMKVDNRAIWLVTGNNLRPVGDLNRRIFTCRIDPKMESTKVYKREFDVNPAEYCLRNRMKMIRAALTVLRAYIAAGRPKHSSRLASFEDWSELVLRAVAWCGAEGLADVADPIELLDRQSETDPDRAKLASLLAACYGVAKGGDFSVGMMINATEDEKIYSRLPKSKVEAARERVALLRTAMKEIASDGNKINPRMLGRWIEARAGRIVDGLFFVRTAKKTDGVAWWRVESVNSPPLASFDEDAPLI